MIYLYYYNLLFVNEYLIMLYPAVHFFQLLQDLLTYSFISFSIKLVSVTLHVRHSMTNIDCSF